ncbi:MAG: hypothetical protein ABH808_00620 [Candidatus Kuenenbacteria bacterium]
MEIFDDKFFSGNLGQVERERERVISFVKQLIKDIDKIFSQNQRQQDRLEKITEEIIPKIPPKYFKKIPGNAYKKAIFF